MLPEIIRGSTSLGNTPSSSLRTPFSWSVASSEVVPNAKETRRTESPVVEVTVVDSTPWSPITACSSTDETWLSTTSGEAPG